MDPTFPAAASKELVTLCAMPRLHERQLRRALRDLHRKEADFRVEKWDFGGERTHES